MAAKEETEPQHRWISGLLVMGHMVETGLQLYLCYHYWTLTTRWAAGMAALLAASVLVINAASIVGVRRALDFTDRWFGQCLCYVMHLSLLGLIWRFLKLTFLYDRTDLRELALLRFIQVTHLSLVQPFRPPFNSFRWTHRFTFRRFRRCCCRRVSSTSTASSTRP